MDKELAVGFRLVVSIGAPAPLYCPVHVPRHRSMRPVSLGLAEANALTCSVCGDYLAIARGSTPR